MTLDGSKTVPSRRTKVTESEAQWFWCSLHQAAENLTHLQLPAELPYHAHIGPFATRKEAEAFQEGISEGGEGT